MSSPTRLKNEHRKEPQVRSVGLVFAALMLVMLLASLSQTVLSTALPTIVGALDGADLILWVITAYLLSSTITMPIYGRVSDQLGRKAVLLSAIVLFVAGSLVGALAWDMNSLIAARVIQGLGGGGLMVLSQAAIADVVPARERGKYMGLLGSAFAVSSVAGPLLGGWFTEGPGWRWTFWINVPLGILAFGVTAWLLHSPRPQRAANARADYWGMMLLSVATTALILATTWGGHRYDWISVEIIGLIAVTVLAVLAFIWAEHRASEPIIPLSLFRDRNFNLTTLGALALGIAMFGAIGYMPTYLQMSMGVDATKSGLMMIPMMGGLLGASTVTGFVVSRTGRYRVYPIVGAVVTMLGLWLLSTIEVSTQAWLVELYMGIFGIGLGLALQVLTLIVQNSVPHAIVGTATAASNYFRQVGATLGSAVVGTIFTTRLMTTLTSEMPQSASGSELSANSLTPEALAELPPRLHEVVVQAYNDALMPIFLALVPLLAFGLVALWFVVETPLSRTIGAASVDHEDAAESGFDNEATNMDLDIADDIDEFPRHGEVAPTPGR